MDRHVTEAATALLLLIASCAPREFVADEDRCLWIVSMSSVGVWGSVQHLHNPRRVVLDLAHIHASQREHSVCKCKAQHHKQAVNDDPSIS